MGYNTDLIDIALGILTEVYAEAEPGLDFRKAWNGELDLEDDWYKNHYIDSEREKSIFEKHVKDFDLTRREHSQLTVMVMLSYGPSNTPPEER